MRFKYMDFSFDCMSHVPTEGLAGKQDVSWSRLRGCQGAGEAHQTGLKPWVGTQTSSEDWEECRRQKIKKANP